MRVSLRRENGAVLNFNHKVYPFLNVVNTSISSFKTTVRYKIENSSVQRIINTCHEHLVGLVKISREPQEGWYSFYYEPVAYSLQAVTEDPTANIGVYRAILRTDIITSLRNLLNYLISNGVIYCLRYEDIGFTEKGVLKVYLSPEFFAAQQPTYEQMEEALCLFELTFKKSLQGTLFFDESNLNVSSTNSPFKCNFFEKQDRMRTLQDEHTINNNERNYHERNTSCEQEQVLNSEKKNFLPIHEKFSREQEKHSDDKNRKKIKEKAAQILKEVQIIKQQLKLSVEIRRSRMVSKKSLKHFKKESQDISFKFQDHEILLKKVIPSFEPKKIFVQEKFKKKKSIDEDESSKRSFEIEGNDALEMPKIRINNIFRQTSFYGERINDLKKKNNEEKNHRSDSAEIYWFPSEQDVKISLKSTERNKEQKKNRSKGKEKESNNLITKDQRNKLNSYNMEDILKEFKETKYEPEYFEQNEKIKLKNSFAEVESMNFKIREMVKTEDKAIKKMKESTIKNKELEERVKNSLQKTRAVLDKLQSSKFTRGE